MHIWGMIPEAWRRTLELYAHDGDFRALESFLAAETQREEVFPPREQWFTALELTPPEAVKVVILGQDPYHDDGQAHGLAFSVPPGQPLPPSLRNIYKELAADLDLTVMPSSGCLENWARQGVLLLNTVLTVRAHEAGSHQKRGWEAFTDLVIKAVSDRPRPAVFWLWGNFARSKAELIHPRHLILESVHPSPLSASRGFFGSKPFSKTNAWLASKNVPPVRWDDIPLETVQPDLFEP